MNVAVCYLKVFQVLFQTGVPNLRTAEPRLGIMILVAMQGKKSGLKYNDVFIKMIILILLKFISKINR